MPQEESTSLNPCPATGGTTGTLSCVGAVRAKLYTAIFLVPVFVAATVLLALYGFLVRSEETLGPITAAHEQESSSELYGPALTYRPFPYKLERYRLKQPDILLIGSSRVLPFAGEAFTVPIVNAGGAGTSMRAAIAFIRDAIAIHRPKSILLGVDFWWFNQYYADEMDVPNGTSDTVELSLDQLFMPLRWMLDNNLHVSAFFQALSPFGNPPPGIGAFAKFADRGWDVYGRYDYGAVHDGRMVSVDRQFKDSLKRIKRRKKSQTFNTHLTPSRDVIEALRSLLTELRSQSIEVIVFIPPLAGPVRETIDRDPENQLSPLLRQALRSLDVPVFDFENASAIGSNDCEFLDGYHGGEVTYLRMLNAIAQSSSGYFAAAIKRDFVTSSIAANAGHARLAELRPADVLPEVDFLQLGCDKSR
jgi:hypothetical protein